MDPRDLMITIYRKTGKNRSITGIQNLLCIGVLDTTIDSLEKAAIKFRSDGSVYIDKSRCSKCYLCKLKSKYIHLDSENYPYVSDQVDNRSYDITNDDQIHFESNLSTYNEESGISKWIYCLFKIYGIDETYTECAISKEYIPKDVLERLGKYRADAVYSKSVVVDLESTVREFIFIFENKKSNIHIDDWIVEAFKQIIAYASSSIYKQVVGKELYFVFCYNGSYDVTSHALQVLKQKKLLHILQGIFKEKKNYHLVILNSAKIFEVVKETLKTNKKDKEQIINLVLKNEVRLFGNNRGA